MIRFLENNGDPVHIITSADWMERNLNNRIEVCFPILKKKHISRIKAELEMYLNDRSQSWELNAIGEYRSLETASSVDESLEDVQMLLLKQLS